MNALLQLKKEKKELEARLKTVSKAISALEPVPVKHMQWKQKAINCIKRNEFYSQSSEILECVVGEEITNDQILRRRYMTALSVALTYLVRDRELKSFRVKKIKGDFYGLPEWFNKDGSLKDEYLSERLTDSTTRNIHEMMKA